MAIEFMTKKTYARLGRIAHSAATPVLRVYMKGQRRVRVLVINEKDEILLVRSWFGHQQWSLPGGGIRRSESSAAAGAREVFEETGVTIDERKSKFLGEFENGDSNAPFIIDCQIVSIEKQPAHIAARRRLEMLDVAWFSMKHLPSHRSKTVDNAMKLFKKN
jgi:8-oxo-dGTP pyrophosphatase MutT (NUDIX family)